MMIRMNVITAILSILAVVSAGWSQDNNGDVRVTTGSDRSLPPVNRISMRPSMIDTAITSPITDYPLLVLQENTSFEIDKIAPANIRHRPQLPQLYRGYAKLGAGSRLMGLGEVYYNSLRSRKYHWGVHAKHLSEWGQIPDVAPSQYDRTKIRAFGKVEERRYSYGGEIGYKNYGLHYYGFENPDADRDSISQRYQSVDFSGFFDAHKKDSAMLNYRIGVDYSNFMDQKPAVDSLDKWRGKENNVGVRSTWQYNMSNNVLLSNLRADADISFNDYRYGIRDSSIAPSDTGFVHQNTLVELRPVTSFYSLNEKLHFKLGGALALNINREVQASLYPIAEVKYSLFDDLFIPYAGVEGGMQQRRFAHLARTNEFIRSNVELNNRSRYEAHFGIKGTLSSKMSFNLGASFATHRNQALYVNDTVLSSGNQFRVMYDTVNISTISGSLSYQQNEKLKIDGIARFHSYQARNNPYAWNLPQFEFIARGNYNIADKLLLTLDFTLETGRVAKAFDPNQAGVLEEDGQLYRPLGVIADANIGAEFRYTKRISIFANFNNVAAQRYKRWYGYPVQGFQFMAGATFRF
ncbi:MAG: hypothetical protein ACQERC_09885 [Bacteroidota bacterium]